MRMVSTDGSVMDRLGVRSSVSVLEIPLTKGCLYTKVRPVLIAVGIMNALTSFGPSACD